MQSNKIIREDTNCLLNRIDNERFCNKKVP